MWTCKEFHIQTNQARVRRKNAAAKALTISPKGRLCLGVQKTAPVCGSVFYVDIARYFFSNMKRPSFYLKIGVSFCCFSVVAFALLRPRVGYPPTAKLAMGSLAQNSSGAIRCSCNPRFRRRFRRVPESSRGFRCRKLMRFQRVPVQKADEVPDSSDADG